MRHEPGKLKEDIVENKIPTLKRDVQMLS